MTHFRILFRPKQKKRFIVVLQALNISAGQLQGPALTWQKTWAV